MKLTVPKKLPDGFYPHRWNYVGYDECNYTLTPQGIGLLRDFAKLEKEPYYVRTHHLFCTGNCGAGFYKWGSTNLYHEDENGNAVYDYTVIDKILATILETGNKPFMELGFTPMDLVDPKLFGNDDPYARYNHYQRDLWATPPKDYHKWYELIKNLSAHLVERFGIDEVKTWYFELWNEPDIFYWTGTEEDYFRLYDETEAGMHDACPELQLGGPATTGPFKGTQKAEYLRHFLEHTRKGTNYHTGKTGTRLDLITFHTKGGGLFFDPWDAKKAPSVDVLMDQVEYGVEMIRDNGYENLPLILSEADPDGWAAGGVGDNPNMAFRNTEYYATFILSAYLRLMDLGKRENMDIRPIAWAFLFPGERCFEGTRTFTTQGIHKASFAAMQLLAKLGTNRIDLDVSDAPEKVNAVATVSDDYTAVLVTRHEDDWDIREKLPLQVDLSAYKPTSLKAYLIDSAHSNPYAQWAAMGRPDYPEESVKNLIKRYEGLQEIELTPDRNGTVSYDLEGNSALLLVF